MFRPKLAVWLLVALVAAWLASCSSNVDGYHLATDESGFSANPTGGASRGAGATGGTSTNGGASTNGGRVGIAPGGGGAGGGTGGRDLDSGPDGDSSLGGTGGVLVGGAGGDNTGGSLNGGALNGGAGGIISGGGPNTGGAPAGGTQNTGGTPTGGIQNTGGAPTGGRGNTGGQQNTGGAPPTGGVPNTGGAPPTGGVPNTGGAPPTGGVPNTGGAPPTYPGDPTQVTLTGASLTDITAASWEPSSQQFYLLKPSTRQYFVMTTGGVVSGPNALQGTGTVGQSVFGASATDVFFVTGSAATLFRQPIVTGTAFQLAIPGSPAAGVLSGAYANGWFFVGNGSGASQALNDGSTTFGGGASGLSGVYVVTTDTDGFAFRTLGTANTSIVHDISPPGFTLNSPACAAGGFSQNGSSPLGIFGNNVAWVLAIPAGTTQFRLHVATVTSGSCGSPVTANFGTANASQAVGLIDATHALVTSDTTNSVARVEILEAGNPAFSRTPLVNVDMGGGGFPRMFVMAKEATPTHLAVLVTKNIPALISF